MNSTPNTSAAAVTARLYARVKHSAPKPSCKVEQLRRNAGKRDRRVERVEVRL